MAREKTLPMLWLLSDARNDARLETALDRLPAGSGFVFRHYHLAPEPRRARYAALSARARALGHMVALAGGAPWDAEARYGAAPGPGLRLATAHSLQDLIRAAAQGSAAVFLSPVFPTASHPGAETLGVAGFHALARQSLIPVIALGGMTAARAQTLDWPRWGAIDGLA